MRARRVFIGRIDCAVEGRRRRTPGLGRTTLGSRSGGSEVEEALAELVEEGRHSGEGGGAEECQGGERNKQQNA